MLDRLKYLVLIWIVSALALTASAYAESIEPTRRKLLDEPVSGDETKHGVTLMIDWPAGASVGDHTHPGDEYAVVIEGAIELTTEGKDTQIYKAGEAYHNAKGVVHAARAADGKPAKTIATMIVEKGKPLSQRVE